MELYLPDAERVLVQRAVDHMIAGDEELGRHCARLALCIDGSDQNPAPTLRLVAARLDVLRARLQATRELLTEVLIRAQSLPPVRGGLVS